MSEELTSEQEDFLLEADREKYIERHCTLGERMTAAECEE